MIATLFLTILVYRSNAQKTTVWTETFNGDVVSTDCQCQKWIDFWQFWIGDPSQVVSITLGGSLTSTTYTCSGSAAQFVAFALATPPYETTQVTCESGIWYTGATSSTGSAVSIVSKTTECSTNPAIRPCWKDASWGGIGSANCAAPSQLLTVTVMSDVQKVAVPPASVTWTDTFELHRAVTSAKCTKWKQFWQNTVPRSGSLSVTLTSSFKSGFSATCSGPGVNLLATALFTPTSNGSYHCNEGTVWNFNDVYKINYPRNTSAIAVGNTPINCAADWALRPCWDTTANWGGFGGVTCDAQTQTFTAAVTIGKNSITNACWQQVNVEISTGSFTISCNVINLQCNSNYNASGYEPKSSGVYSCTNNVWSPAVPTCYGIPTSQPTSQPISQPTSHPVVAVVSHVPTQQIQSEPAQEITAKPSFTKDNSPSVFEKSPWLMWVFIFAFLIGIFAFCCCLRPHLVAKRNKKKTEDKMQEGKKVENEGNKQPDQIDVATHSVGPPKPI